jgi:hypothetical protein
MSDNEAVKLPELPMPKDWDLCPESRAEWDQKWLDMREEQLLSALTQLAERTVEVERLKAEIAAQEEHHDQLEYRAEENEKAIAAQKAEIERLTKLADFHANALADYQALPIKSQKSPAGLTYADGYSQGRADEALDNKNYPTPEQESPADAWTRGFRAGYLSPVIGEDPPYAPPASTEKP